MAVSCYTVELMRLVRCFGEKIDLVFLQIYPVKELSFGLTCTPWYRSCGFFVFFFFWIIFDELVESAGDGKTTKQSSLRRSEND